MQHRDHRGVRVVREFLVVVAATVFGVWFQSANAKETTKPRPNFLIILADDLGYSDLGSFGGEIDTPNLDRLARSGLRFSSFYAAPTCSPTRAMLLSGVDAHTAGLGTMAEGIAPNQQGKDGYEGYLSRRVVTIAELLRDAGYATLMAGKWHLGLEDSQSPAARGFGRSFALLQGGGSHFDMSGLMTAAPVSSYRQDDRLIKRLPKDFYSSDYYTERMIEYLGSTRRDQPFFAYMAFTAPHWPLQAPAELIKKYADRYRAGPAVLRQARLQGLIREQLVQPGINPHPFDPPASNWRDLDPSTRELESRKMAIYAAMVDRLDWNVGRVIHALEKLRRLDNTYVIFMSDNGPEGHNLAEDPEFTDFIKTFDNSLGNLGHVHSYIWYGAQWAEAAAPFRLFKGYPTEGGVHVPAFIWGPLVKAKGGITQAVASVMDVTPTLLELAKVEVPSGFFHGRPVAAIEGQSLVKLLEGRVDSARGDQDTLAWELFGKSGIRQGIWKAVRLAPPVKHGVWELYNLERDLGENNNLAQSNPARLSELIALWQQYAEQHRVVLPDSVSDY